MRRQRTPIEQEHWRWVKEQREAEVGMCCEWEACDDFWDDGHHVDYSHWGRERVEDIRLLCRRHHDDFHYAGPVSGQLSFDDMPCLAYMPTYVEEPNVVLLPKAANDSIAEKARRMVDALDDADVLAWGRRHLIKRQQNLLEHMIEQFGEDNSELLRQMMIDDVANEFS
jgi:hypothetical protein